MGQFAHLCSGPDCYCRTASWNAWMLLCGEAERAQKAHWVAAMTENPDLPFAQAIDAARDAHPFPRPFAEWYRTSDAIGAALEWEIAHGEAARQQWSEWDKKMGATR